MLRPSLGMLLGLVDDHHVLCLSHVLTLVTAWQGQGSVMISMAMALCRYKFKDRWLLRQVSLLITGFACTCMPHFDTRTCHTAPQHLRPSTVTVLLHS